MNMLELLNQKITIPSIQRDFAMGRNDNRSRDIREKFIRELLNAVYDAAPLHLDFVYGLNQGDVLLPLDGQQRLTMLYLLAWFCGVNLRRWEFDYESRRSTEFFMEGLKNHPRSSDSVMPSVEICRCAWFAPAWKLDPSVAGMLQVLDDMAKIKSEREYARVPDFANIRFERFDIGSSCASKEYGNIFLKMNARGLPLTSWENLKAVLDIHAPDEEWKEKIATWQEKVWSMMPSQNNFARNIEWFNIAMEKIVRVFATSFLYDQNTKETKYGVSAFRLGNVVCEHGAFYQQCSRCFEKLPEISEYWSETRCENRLWGGDGNFDLRNWLFDSGEPSLASQLRLIFLSAKCDDKRRLRTLLNLLDNSDVSAKKYRAVLDGGLKYLRDGELPSAESGFNAHQLDDEMYKVAFVIPDTDIMELEKHPLVWRGSLSFLHQKQEFLTPMEMNSRLTLLSNTIQNRWQELYFAILSCMPYADNDNNRVPERICIPRQDAHLWAQEIFANQKHERLHHGLAAFYNGSGFDAESAPAWLIHLKELIDRDRLPDDLKYIKYARGWNYCIKDAYLSGNAVRLAWSACELEHLKKLKKDYFRNGEIPYHGYFQIDGTNRYYQIADNGDASWYESNEPHQFLRRLDDDGNEVFERAE